MGEREKFFGVVENPARRVELADLEQRKADLVAAVDRRYTRKDSAEIGRPETEKWYDLKAGGARKMNIEGNTVMFYDWQGNEDRSFAIDDDDLLEQLETYLAQKESSEA